MVEFLFCDVLVLQNVMKLKEALVEKDEFTQGERMKTTLGGESNVKLHQRVFKGEGMRHEM